MMSRYGLRTQASLQAMVTALDEVMAKLIDMGGTKKEQKKLLSVIKSLCKDGKGQGFSIKSYYGPISDW